MSQPRIILVGGPTASGKSAFAMQLARQSGGVIINTDAMQVYAGLPLLTAQPKSEDRTEIPHLLYEITDTAEASSAGIWLRKAQAAIQETLNAGKTPILVGGTGLYFEALKGGLANIPNIPDELRDEVIKLYSEQGEEKFRAVLALLDPESAARIERNDQQRLVRAYTVVKYTGKALGQWQKEGADSGIGQADFEHHLLLPKREQLYAACDARFTAMIEAGAMDEVKRLVSRNLLPTLPAMKILGVREIAAYLRGECDLETAIAKAQQMTRNYAKRQMTWFRNRW